jgi:GNAT superfamily N-acetyltransferase
MSDSSGLEHHGNQPTSVLRLSPPLANPAVNALFAAAWPQHRERDWAPVLSRSLCYVGAFQQGALIGFVNVAWDGGAHAFLLDTTVHPSTQRQGLGTRLVRAAAITARERGMEWLHVDYEPHLEAFYRGCGFAPTQAGLLRLSEALLPPG